MQISIIIIILNQFITPVKSLSTVGTSRTQYYEPSCIETGSHQFIPTNTTITPTGYNDDFTLTFQRIQLQSSQNRIILSIRDLDINLLVISQTSINLNRNPNLNNYWSTSYIIAIRITNNNQMTLLRLRVSYLLVAKRLSTQQDFVITDKYTTWGQPNSFCNGTTTIAVCFYIKNLTTPVQSTDYRVFCNIFGYLFTNPNLVNPPEFSVHVLLLNSTTFQIQLITNHVAWNMLDYTVIVIKERLFDSTQTNQVMFTCQHLTLTSTNYTLSLNYMASDNNVYFGLKGFNANPINYQLVQNTPINNIMLASLDPLSSYYFLTALAFYGFTKDCPLYAMNWMCLPCPQGCAKCNVYPSFYCELCQINFQPVGNMSCICPSPFSIVSDICDIFPWGCVSGQRLLNGTVQCSFCNTGQGLILNATYQCECKLGYQFDLNGSSCIDKCGDGFIINTQCDDGNTLSNDGCNTTCFLELGFELDTSTTPPTIKSQILLQYKVKEILRDEFTNSATLELKLKNSFTLPFPLTESNFKPLPTYFTLKVIISKYPPQQQDFQITEITIDSDGNILIKFDFDFTIETLSAELNFNYQKTKYKNDTQRLQFVVKGVNKPLRFQSNMATYKALGQGLMVGAILNVVCLLIGLLTPKFIGLESILTLQMIYYSQILIFNVKQWPAGFLFLKYLKIAGGYNDIFEYTEYFLLSSLSKKMDNLFIKKLIIQNFNINFLIILTCSILLCGFTWVRNKKQKFVFMKIKEKSQISNRKKQDSSFDEKSELLQLQLLNRLNQAFFWVASQFIFWLLLPLVCAIGSYLLIPNSSYQFISSQDQSYWSIKFQGLIIFISLFFTFAIGSNNFFNFWLSLSSYNKLLQRPQEITYKRALFIYLLIQGSLIFFFNDFAFGPLYTSVLVMLIHLIYILLLIRINPYKQSLRVHTICLLFNQGVYLGFIFVINLINFIESIPSLIILILGYFVTICCAVSIILTVVRLYYELRYGPALQEQIQEERRKQKEEERLRKQRLLKRKQDELEEQAKLKISQKEQIRQKNDFLFENQVNEEKKIELLKWLQTRKWDQKTKQIYYFKHFAQKPLKWLRENDNQKYSQKLKLIEDIKQERVLKKTQINTDPEYLATAIRLKAQLKEMKRLKMKFNKQLQ